MKIYTLRNSILSGQISETSSFTHLQALLYKKKKIVSKEWKPGRSLNKAALETDTWVGIIALGKKLKMCLNLSNNVFCIYSYSFRGSQVLLFSHFHFWIKKCCRYCGLWICFSSRKALLERLFCFWCLRLTFLSFAVYFSCFLVYSPFFAAIMTTFPPVE